ncbi:hypothetical protein GH714_010128 [Hevea brasiliensis]|uniref:Tonoplast intrinsic protein n=1 Tax=Hevea brasiliensis TaxID=3981 RepID=A0A6A6MXP6_HEVBR|nr:hypothetical protein GH714_010128 [Hevea brasiliensis]
MLDDFLEFLVASPPTSTTLTTNGYGVCPPRTQPGYAIDTSPTINVDTDDLLAVQDTTFGYNYDKLTDNGSTTPAGLIAASLAHAFALFVAVSVGANISGGHVNPAVTFGAFIGGNITLLRGILYWIAQLLGSVVACLLLKFATGGLETSAFALSSGVSSWNALVFEIVMTFGLVYTVYATAVDPKKGNVGIVAPIAIGFIVGANILAGGAFDGASMNPAVSFGPAVVSWTWTSHWSTGWVH